MRPALFFCSLLAVCSAIGCEGNDANVAAGTYKGTLSGSQGGSPFSMSVTFTIDQGGDRFNGTFATDSGCSGPFFGGTTGSRLEFFIDHNGPCPGRGSFGGSGAVSESRIFGSYGCAPCQPPLLVQFEAHK